MYGPALLGAASFACADLLGKVTFRAGGDVLTVATLRGVIGVGILAVWVRLTAQPVRIAGRRAQWIALGLGALFAANVFLLFKAIDAIDVAVAILTYFVYPLLTGIAAAVLGLEKLSWRGALAALSAFLGLGMMLGAHPAGLALAGVLAALGAAGCRVVLLLVTRATMQGVDPLAMTLYSLVSSTALLVAVSVVTLNWQPPLTTSGWLALIGLSIFDHDGNPRRVRLDRADRPVPHRAVHESRAAAHGGRQRHFPRRAVHAAAGARWRGDDRGAHGVPAAALMQLG